LVFETGEVLQPRRDKLAQDEPETRTSGGSERPAQAKRPRRHGKDLDESEGFESRQDNPMGSAVDVSTDEGVMDRRRLENARTR